jgi:hypothetical protein
MWDPVPSPAAPEPIRVATHPAALIESLGPPALRGSASAVENYIVSVVERAAGLAAALADSAGLLDETEKDEDAALASPVLQAPPP